jgi:hypothetical protein
MTPLKKWNRRTVSLTPIQSEVDSYVEWLKSKGYRVVAVKWSKAAGVDVQVTFEYPAE